MQIRKPALAHASWPVHERYLVRIGAITIQKAQYNWKTILGKLVEFRNIVPKLSMGYQF